MSSKKLWLLSILGSFVLGIAASLLMQEEMSTSTPVFVSTSTSSFKNLVNQPVDINSLPTRENLGEHVAAGYFGEGRIVCYPNILYCQHEVGHALDDFLGHPSGTEEFKEAINIFIGECKAELIVDHLCSMVGYEGEIGELYAQIFEMSHTAFIPIHPFLSPFFNLGWKDQQ